MFVRIGGNTRENDDPIAMMSDCHKRIEYFLYLLITIKRLAQGGPLSTQQRQTIRRALSFFEEAAPKHTADEESSLFPLLKERAATNSGILDVLERLMSEHGIAESDHSELKWMFLDWIEKGSLTENRNALLTESLSRLSHLYHDHIMLEDQMIFPFAKSVMSDEDKMNLRTEMAARRGISRTQPPHMNLTWETIPKRIHRPKQVSATLLLPEKKIGFAYNAMLPFGFLLFLAAIVTGLWRISLMRGIILPSIPEWWPPHGHLILGGFLTLLIMWERMIALRIGSLAWVPYLFAATAALIHTDHPFIRILHIAALIGWLLHRIVAAHVFHHRAKSAMEAAGLIVVSAALLSPGGFMGGPIAALCGYSFVIGAIVVERLELGLKFRTLSARLAITTLGVWYAALLLSLRAELFTLPQLGLLALMLVCVTSIADLGLHSVFSAKPATIHNACLHGKRIGHGLRMVIWRSCCAYFLGSIANRNK